MLSERTLSACHALSLSCVTLHAGLHEVLRILRLVLVEFVHGRALVALDLLSLHLEHIDDAKHLIAAEFELLIPSDVLDRQVGHWVLDLVVLHSLHDRLECEANRGYLSFVEVCLSVDRAATTLARGSSHSKLLLLLRLLSSKGSKA